MGGECPTMRKPVKEMCTNGAVIKASVVDWLTSSASSPSREFVLGISYQCKIISLWTGLALPQT